MHVGTKAVCFFGIYDPQYARNRVLMRGFVENGFRVIECRADVGHFHGISKYIELYKQFRKIKHEHITFVLVAFPGQSVVWLARLLFRQPIVFDAFVSLYDSNVFDRKIYGPHSFGARIDRQLDYWSAKLASHVLMDTNEHCDYYASEYHLPREKFIRVLLGAETEIFYPRDVPLSPGCTVHFHGRFIPLQGISYIIEAANLLRDESIQFRLVGTGQTYAAVRAEVDRLGLTNVVFTPDVPLEELPNHIAPAQICLGIFGDTPKTGRVIPNKVYECLAMGKPVITADTPAVREIFHDGEELLVCPVADSAALAAAILRLKQDAGLRERLGSRALEYSQAFLAPARVVAELLQAL